ncbi:MAG: hypothetical protein QOH21_439 [Acidobacteriota bacterium]|jgi:hypothetical protein|nr:hypothetical protein [Acidobacteriota bacterium]
MNTKSEWNAIHAELLAEGRARLGGPPTEEQLLAYGRGELHGEEEARVRELLVYYPELARTLDNPSSADVQPGDADYLSDDELAEDWRAIQERLHGTVQQTGGRVLPFWPTLAAAAALLLVCGGLLFRAHSEPVEYTAMPSVAIDEVVLVSGARRGSEEVPTVSANTNLLLTAPLVSEREYPDYRLDIVEADTVLRRTIWSSRGLRHRPDDTFHILVPHAFLKPGKYRLVIYGLDGGKQDELAQYTVLVTKR